MRSRVQKFGTFLSTMVMPNMGAFIAWGLITALFIESGWINAGGQGGWAPDSWVARLGGWGDYADGGIVSPTITYLLPLLIGYSGGRMMYDVRGGVVGAIATMGVIVGTDIPMFLGAMLMGPLGGWTMKRIDAAWDGKIKPGFEMLVNNFSAGIWGGILAVAGFFGIGPVVEVFSRAAGNVVQWLVEHSLLPLTSLLIEPAKVLFLNNAINHGVLTPLGTAEAANPHIGKSVLFLLEANPGPGLGLLLAFIVFGKGMAKASAPGAALIHFVGGIHEIYFPYVLAKPKLIVAMIAGGMTQILINVLFGTGLYAPAAPGSIIAVLLQTSRDSYVGVIASVAGGALASFLVAALLLKTDRTVDDGDLTSATASMEAMKGKASVASSALTRAATPGPISTIVFACDAGMGSSAMGASVLRRKIAAAGHDGVTVVNKAIADLTDTFDLVVTHEDLAARAEEKTPSAHHVCVSNFMASERYDEIVALLDRQADTHTSTATTATDAPARHAGEEPAQLLPADSIILSGKATCRDDAITEAGELLLASGAVDQAYVDSLHERERSVSTYMGNYLAIPHGTNEAKAFIHRSALAFVRYPDGIDWGAGDVKFVVAVAGAGGDHLTLLSKLAGVFVDSELVARLEAAQTRDDVLAVLDSVRAE